jgi:HTH-type transcriptional regulator, sugar sensing transcriptional regulator
LLKATDLEIISRFEHLGLSNYEARVYVFLLRKGQSYGNEISKNTGIPGSKIYETLSRLVEKGLAHLIQTKPVRYQALPLEEFLRMWQTDASRIIQYLNDNKEQIEAEPQSELMWHISGKKQLLDKLKDIIDSARSEIIISLWPREAAEVKDNLLEAQDRNVKITSIQFGEISLNIGKVFQHVNTSTIEARHGSELFVLADKRRGMFMYYENSKGWVGYHSNSSGIARVIENYIRHDIYTNKIINDHPELAMRSYGKDLAGLIDLD